jgi:RNA-directed DNA polymerase
LPETIAFVDGINGLVRPGSELEEIIRENHFKLNPLKSRLSKNQQAKYVTGVKVNLTPNVSRDYVRQIRNMLNAWRKYGLDAAQKDFENKFGGGDRRFIDVLRGKIAYLKSIKTDSDLTYAKTTNTTRYT